MEGILNLKRIIFLHRGEKEGAIQIKSNFYQERFFNYNKRNTDGRGTVSVLGRYLSQNALPSKQDNMFFCSWFPVCKGCWFVIVALFWLFIPLLMLCCFILLGLASTWKVPHYKICSVFSNRVLRLCSSALPVSSLLIVPVLLYCISFTLLFSTFLFFRFLRIFLSWLS